MSNNVKNIGEGQNDDREEQEEDFQVIDDLSDHSHDVAELLDDSESLKSTEHSVENDKDHEELGAYWPGAVEHLEVDVHVPKNDMAGLLEVVCPVRAATDL